MSKQIKINVEGKTAVSYDKLVPFQNDLKTLSKEQYEKMRANLISEGFCFTVHVWPNGGLFHIIDGHQRMFTVKQMVEVEGWKVADIPVSIVHAETFEEAKRKVLAGASVYGRMTEDSLFDFMKEGGLDFEDIAGKFDFHEIDFGDFSDKFFGEDRMVGNLPPPDQDAPDMPSSSSQVKQIQLLFNSGSHEEFLVKAQALSTIYKTENITDTLMEVLRADHQSKFGKS